MTARAKNVLAYVCGMNCLTYRGGNVDEKAQFKKQSDVTNIASPV